MTVTASGWELRELDCLSKSLTAWRMRLDASTPNARRPAVAPTRTGVKGHRSLGTAASALWKRSESDRVALRGLEA